MTNTAQNLQTPPAMPTGANVVYVACKLPHGIVLETGGSPGDESYKRAVVRGPLRRNGEFDKSGEFAITAVPASLWEAWAAYSHKDVVAGKNTTLGARGKTHPAIKAGTLFAHADRNEVEAHCALYSLAKTGQERLTPKDLKDMTEDRVEALTKIPKYDGVQ